MTYELLLSSQLQNIYVNWFVYTYQWVYESNYNIILIYTFKTWAFFINIFILGILTLSNAKYPLLVEFIPNLPPISPIFMPDTTVKKLYLFKS